MRITYRSSSTQVGRVTGLLILASAAAGCGPTIHEARFRSYPPRPSDAQIAVCQTKAPECAFDEVGTVFAEKSHRFVSAQAVLDGLLDHARRMGGDAVVELTTGTALHSSGSSDSNVSVDGKLTYTATVIRFTDPSCTKAPD